MPTYIALLDWTDQGIRNFRESIDRYDAARQQFEQLGVSFKDIYWTLGSHDIVVIAEAPDDETFAAVMLALGGQGNVRSKTLRGFSADELRGVIAKVPGWS